MALAVADRLGLSVLPLAGPGMIELYGVVTRAPASSWAWPDVEVWAWVDASPEHRVQSVVKATAGTTVVMPWQDAVASLRRTFVPGFDD